MNFSKLSKLIYGYLGYRSVQRSEQTDKVIAECVKELEEIAHFRYVYKYFSAPPEFLNKPPYLDYLKGCSGVIISAMTLGGEVDRRIKQYERTDAAKAVVMDSCASAYLELLSDGYEASLGDNLAYRFCPGYGGSDVSDLKYIFEILHPEKVGITLSNTFYMLPSKSMAGIIAAGSPSKKNCGGCIIGDNCTYKKEGTTCYGSEKE